MTTQRQAGTIAPTDDGRVRQAHGRARGAAAGPARAALGLAAGGGLALVLWGGPAAAATTTTPFSEAVTLVNPCAVFRSAQEPQRITYGETIAFDLQGQLQTHLANDGGRLRIAAHVHGDGVGLTSGIDYRFQAQTLLAVDEGDDGVDLTLALRARIIGAGGDASGATRAIGAQDNAVVRFRLRVRETADHTEVAFERFTVECAASPWTNQTEAREATTKQPVQRGFGDPWNKYAWSMRAFAGGIVVGTRNSWYDVTEFIAPGDDVEQCVDGDEYQTAPPYEPLACAELHPVRDDGSRTTDTRYAELWRFDVAKKTWTKSLDGAELGAQGFRVMEVHDGTLYAGADLGAFITGAALHTGAPGAWDFPGARLLSSTDGNTFTPVDSCATHGPCNSASGVPNPYGVVGAPPTPPFYAVNTSIRALASYDGRLFVGTFNALGGQVWAWDPATDAWAFIHAFPPEKPAVNELRVLGGRLYVGVGGLVDRDYLHVFDAAAPALGVRRVAGQPPLPGTFGTLTLFASGSGRLYVGNVDLSAGFKLLAWDGTDCDDDDDDYVACDAFAFVTEDGFGNATNAYAWSMAEVDGRVVVGTFDQGLIDDGFPRGSAELWVSDESEQQWQQVALPASFGVWNYGLRTMVVDRRQLFVGTASNMVAPDLLPDGPTTFVTPGTEVWSIRDTGLSGLLGR